MMKKYTAAPHPFIIEPPMEDLETYRAEQEMSFGLVLIGRAIDYLPYFIYAFEELGRIGIGRGKGKYHLVKVAEESPLLEHSSQGGENHQKVIYRGHDKMLATGFGPVHWPDIINSPPPSRVRLHFLTPTRIKYENSLTKELEFHVFFRNLLRRISMLSYFHCGQKLEDSGFKDLIEQATKINTVSRNLHWEDWERYSNRQETRMKMGGLLGEAIYEGDFSPFWPYIRLGEYVHVGKGSSFGLGRFEVSLP
ncbi:MAG: CRISPR system precrRNA processing endoribonuclease RAMP protein Cas6 [bacterium]